ncbi:MAG: hypothetical protein QOD86_373 [Miltoncostaeaceae bacterium]|nr:hypothetical protein [Miltoncostaeaceae bacterium]
MSTVVAAAEGAGSRPDFSTAAEAHLDDVYRYLIHMTGNRDLAEDLTADTFERALRAWGRYRPSEGPMLSWLLGIARHRALDHFRRERRRRDRDARYGAVQPRSSEPPDLPGGLSAPMRAALERLEPRDRELIGLRVVLGLDATTAAKILDITPTTCTTRLHRALGRLRKEVSPDDVT